MNFIHLRYRVRSLDLLSYTFSYQKNIQAHKRMNIYIQTGIVPDDRIKKIKYFTLKIIQTLFGILRKN